MAASLLRVEQQWSTDLCGVKDTQFIPNIPDPIRSLSGPDTLVTEPKRLLREVGAVAAKKKFSELLDQAAQGEEIAITRHGKPVARLVATTPGPRVRPSAGPKTDFDREKARRAVTGILETSKGLTLGGLKIKDLVNEGRP